MEWGSPIVTTPTMRRSGRIGGVVQDGAVALACPRCGSTRLHHTVVRLFQRERDDERTLVVDVADRTVMTTSAASAIVGNPSEREDGLTIQFWCEECGGGDEAAVFLDIAQEENGTSLVWRFEPLEL